MSTKLLHLRGVTLNSKFAFLGRQWDRGIPSGLRNFGEKLKSAMRRRVFGNQIENSSPASHPAVLKLIGATWGVVREEDGYSVEDGVRRLREIAKFPIDIDDLMLFEVGWIDPADYKEGLIEALGKAYGNQSLAEVQQRFFASGPNRPRNLT